MIKVAVNFSSNGMVYSSFPEELLSICLFSGVPLKVIRTDSAQLEVNRNNGIYMAQEAGCSHILFLDTDMLFPRDLIPRFLKHDKDIVGASYLRRFPPYSLLGRFTDKKEGILQDAIELPGGCLMVKMSVFDKLEKPYFRKPSISSASKIPEEVRGFDWSGYEFPIVMSDDFYFCQSIRNAGLNVWADMEVTKIVSHLSVRPITAGDQDVHN